MPGDIQPFSETGGRPMNPLHQDRVLLIVPPRHAPRPRTVVSRGGLQRSAHDRHHTGGARFTLTNSQIRAVSSRCPARTTASCQDLTFKTKSLDPTPKTRHLLAFDCGEPIQATTVIPVSLLELVARRLGCPLEPASMFFGTTASTRGIDELPLAPRRIRRPRSRRCGPLPHEHNGIRPTGSTLW
jgi:hypothetical protein